MKVSATLIDRITNYSVTEDGGHLALTLRDVDAREFTLGIPIEHTPSLIELAARVLDQTAQTSGRRAQMPVMWWNLTRENAGADFILSLTLHSGGSIPFALSEHMASALRGTLNTHFEHRAFCTAASHA